MSETPEINFRGQAINHVKSARELLARTDEQSPVYACLELRFAIEALLFDLLQRYTREVSYGAMEKWTPKKVLDELLSIDPEVTESRTITIKPHGGAKEN